MTDTRECIYPNNLPEGANEFQKLQHMGQVQHYMLCRIQSAEQLLIALSTELSKHSVEAGIQCRDMVREFKEMEMTFLADSRKKMQEQDKKVSPQDILGPDFKG